MNDFIALEEVPCPLGCPRCDEGILVGRDLLRELPGRFNIVKCSNCNLLRTNPRPTSETIGFYYPEDYGPYLGTQVLEARHKRIEGIKNTLKPFVNKVLNFNTSRLPALKPGRMLEIGCASGAFLNKMAGHGWQVQGIEFSNKAAQASRQLGFHIHAGPLETAPDPDAPFDLIVGWMVLEHLHDPIGCLKKLREWAKPGGWLVLSVPNAGSLEFSIFKDKWYALHLPNHLHHFTLHTLELVLSTSGWRLEKVYHHRVLSGLIASAGYFLRNRGYDKLAKTLTGAPSGSGWWNYILYPLALLLGLFGRTGGMTVWARIK